MMPGTTVLVGRKWNNPNITIEVSTEGIEVRMTLEDFLTSVVTEIGSPAMLFRQEALGSAVLEAANRVVAGMKRETERIA